MFCPQCGGEYRDGVETCSDCGVALVASEDEISEDLEPLYTTSDPIELEALLDRLEAARIPYVTMAGTALALLDGRELEEEGQPDRWEARVLVSVGGAGVAEKIREQMLARRRAPAAEPPSEPKPLAPR